MKKRREGVTHLILFYDSFWFQQLGSHFLPLAGQVWGYLYDQLQKRVKP